ncbi:MAG: HAD family hydrolase [Chloroflexota bacterium]
MSSKKVELKHISSNPSANFSDSFSADISKLKLVVFDMAGTTIHDGGEVSRAFRQALLGRHVETTDSDLRAIRGASKREAIRTLLKQSGTVPINSLGAVAEQVYTEFCDILKELFTSEGVVIVDGLLKTLAFLRTRRIHVVLNTGFDREIATLLLNSLIVTNPQLDSTLVDAVICGDDVPQGRPAPYMIFRAMEKTGVHSVHNVMAVGDTVLDIEAAWNAGVAWRIGVLSGAHGKSELEASVASAVIDSVAELPNLIDGIS